MKTIVLSNRKSKDSLIIERAAAHRGYKTIRLTGNNKSEWADEIDLAVYCEGFLAEYISQQSNVVLLRPLDKAMVNAPIELKHRQITLCRASELKGATFPIFIKPVDQKFFKAGVYSDIGKLTKYIEDYPNDMVLTGEIVHFIDEYRHFCFDGKVLTSSPYIINREFVGDNDEIGLVPNSVVSMAEKAINECKHDIPRACVVDIGILDDGSISLIEFNPAWASGVYGTKPDLALECIVNSCIYRGNLTDDISKFETFKCKIK